MMISRVPFSAIFQLGRGLPITRADYIEKGSPCISYGDIHSRYLGFVDASKDKLNFVSSKYLLTNPESLLNEGDFVFADTSEDLAGVGNCTCVLNRGRGLFAGYHTTIARPKIDICSRYFSYYFQSYDFREQLRKKVNGIKVFSITNAILNSTRLIVPDIAEQEKIANCLEERLFLINETIKNKEEICAKLSEYRQSLIEQTVTTGGGLDSTSTVSEN